MRTILFAAVAILLAGCDTGEGWVPGNDLKDAPPPARSSAPTPLVQAPIEAGPTAAPPQAYTPPPAPSPPAAQPIPVVNAHCQAVARQRAADARANGYSFKMEDIIYDGTYRDCVQWDARHGQ